MSTHRLPCPLRKPCVLCQLADLRKRVKQARGYLKCVSSGQFHTAVLVVAAIRALDLRRRPISRRKRR